MTETVQEIQKRRRFKPQDRSQSPGKTNFISWQEHLTVCWKSGTGVSGNAVYIGCLPSCEHRSVILAQCRHLESHRFVRRAEERNSSDPEKSREMSQMISQLLCCHGKSGAVHKEEINISELTEIIRRTKDAGEA
ncbi:MAG: hypothetical protein ACLTNW_17550 [Mediterraneibacter gnavus]